MHKNSLESYVKDFLVENEDMTKSKSSASDWRRFIKQPVNPDLLKPSPAYLERKKKEEEDELAAKASGKSPGISSQIVVSGLEPTKKLTQLVSLSKNKPMRESFIREQVILALSKK